MSIHHEGETDPQGGSGPHTATDGTILLVDDPPAMAEGIRSLLSASYQVELVGNFRQAMEQIGRLARVSLILLDRSLPDADGMLVLSTLRRRHPDIPVAMKLGAAGYIPKTRLPDELCQAVDALIAGNLMLTQIHPRTGTV